MRTGILKIVDKPEAIGGIVDGEDFRLEGSIYRNIEGREITVLRGASVQGDVGARSIVIHGEVHGVVKASSIKVLSTALIVGELQYETLSIDPGAKVEARCIPIH